LKNYSLVKNGNVGAVMLMKNYDDCIVVAMKQSFSFRLQDFSVLNSGLNFHLYLKIIGLKLWTIILRATSVA
jgi:hypothetical protein